MLRNVLRSFARILYALRAHYTAIGQWLHVRIVPNELMLNCLEKNIISSREATASTTQVLAHPNHPIAYVKAKMLNNMYWEDEEDEKEEKPIIFGWWIISKGLCRIWSSDVDAVLTNVNVRNWHTFGIGENAYISIHCDD